MSNKSVNLILGIILSVTFLLNLSYASGIQSTNVSVYLNNTLMTGQQLPPLQSPSQIQWKISTYFSGLTKNLSTTINQSQINYTDFNKVRSTALNSVQVLWKANPANEIYQINGTLLQPVNVMTSNVIVGTVSQSGAYLTATAAPACPTTNLYTEWDFYVPTQKNYTQSVRNIIVGRVCLYLTPIGYAQVLPATPVTQLSSTLILNSGAQQELLYLNYNNTNTISADGLASASWKTNHVYATAAPPNGTYYFAVNNIKTGQWFVHTNTTYLKWYNQLYSFAFEFIPQQTTQYGPTSVGILSPNCGISNTNISNQTVLSLLQCMNSTAKVYYSQANFYASQLVLSSDNVMNYTTKGVTYAGKPAISISIPSIFVFQPKLTLKLSGAFTGLSVPAGKPAIISSSATSLDIFGVGSILMQVENIGNSASLFNVTLANCPGVVTPAGVNYQFLKGQGETISMGIVAPNQTSLISENCILVVQDLSGGGIATAPLTIVSGPGEIIRNYVSRIIHAL